MQKRRIRKWWEVLKNAFNLWMERNAFQHAGSLAFYTIFSLAPIMLIAVSVIGIIFGEEAAQGQIYAQLRDVLGEDAARSIENAVVRSRIEVVGIIPTLTGIGALIVGATTVFAQMQNSLNAIWGVVAKPSKSGIVIFLKTRLLSLALVLIIGFLLLVSLLMSVGLRAVIRYAEEYVPFSSAIATLSELGLSIVVITILFAMIFKILPDVVIRWRDVFLGAAITAVLFTLGRYLISLYLTYTAPGSAYGAAGSLVLVLMWVYYSSLILYFGAAFTKARTLAGGQRIVPRPMAVRVHQEIVEEE